MPPMPPPLESAVVSAADDEPTLLDHFLNTSIGVDFHSIQVVEPVDLCRILAEFLGKGVGEVVSRVGRLLSVGFRLGVQ
jgi:hypothetical protein